MYQAMLSAIRPEAVQSIFAIAFGFGVAGLCASGYRLFRMHFPSFRLLEVGPMPARFAVAEGDIQMNSVIIDVDESTGHARSIERLRLRLD